MIAIIRKRVHGAVFLGGGLILAPLLPAAASPEGNVAALNVRQESYRHYLDDILYARTGHDRSLTGAQHDLARDNIVSLLTGFGLSVTLEPFDVGGSTFNNVVGTKLGTTYPDQIYIVGAHFDSINTTDPHLGAPGADDNASGVALMLEAARVLNEYESEFTIRFIAFDAFEGLSAGSNAYVAAHRYESILGVINCDVVAHDIGLGGVWVGSMLQVSIPFRGALLEAVATYGTGLRGTVGTGLNDQLMFEQAGFPAGTLCEAEPFLNTNLHSAADSLDTPDYIAYEYATQITRIVVGFLVDQAGVHVELPNADYDGDGDVDGDDFVEFELCYAGPGVPAEPPCDFFDLDQDSDVDCDDWNLFEAVWTEMMFPPVFRSCIPALVRPIPSDAGNRCLVVSAPPHGWPMALLVTGDSQAPQVACVSRYMQSDGRLGVAPVFQTFDAWGTVVACGEEIIPQTSYGVQCDYGEPGSPLLSPALRVTTRRWGDVVGDFIGGQWTPPNGIVDFNEIVSLVDTFKHLPTAPVSYLAELVGPSSSACSPDLTIDFLDISAIVDAFKGESYWEATSCAAPCD